MLAFQFSSEGVIRRLRCFNRDNINTSVGKHDHSRFIFCIIAVRFLVVSIECSNACGRGIVRQCGVCG